MTHSAGGAAASKEAPLLEGAYLVLDRREVKFVWLWMGQGSPEVTEMENEAKSFDTLCVQNYL